MGLYTKEQVYKFFEKGVLDETDLVEIESAIKSQSQTNTDQELERILAGQ